MICCDLLSCSTFSFTSFSCVNPASEPIRTPSTFGSPIMFDASLFPSARRTSSTRFSGTIILRTAVHFCPALVVISRTTSLMKISNSGWSGVTSLPRIQQFRESASMVKGTASSINRGCDFSILPVDALPVNVTTSELITLSRIPLALPQISCKAPSGRMPLAIISLATASVRNEVMVAGFTIAGTPASQFTATFSSIPQTGKLNALM